VTFCDQRAHIERPFLLSFRSRSNRFRGGRFRFHAVVLVFRRRRLPAARRTGRVASAVSPGLYWITARAEGQRQQQESGSSGGSSGGTGSTGRGVEIIA